MFDIRIIIVPNSFFFVSQKPWISFRSQNIQLAISSSSSFLNGNYASFRESPINVEVKFGCYAKCSSCL
jgi:hypothetical protein